MPVPCIVAFCGNRGTHYFPTDEPRRTLWIKAIEYKKPRVTLGKHSQICSDHFIPTDFKRTPLALIHPDACPRFLTKTAIPSIFPWKPPETRYEFEEKPIIEKDPLKFNVKNANLTYARRFPTWFVEVQPNFSNAVESDFDVDPLELSKEDFDCKEQLI